MHALRRIGVLAAAAASGAAAFWIPGMLLRGLTGSAVPGFFVVSVLGPLTVRGLALHLARRLARQPGASWIAEAMLAGLWLLGPIFMLTAVVMSGQLSLARALGELFELYGYLPLVPLVTLIFAGSDGSLVGLLAASCALAYTSAELRPEDGTSPIFREPSTDVWLGAAPSAGGRCLVCATGIEDGQARHLCPICETSLHVDCHVYLGGCARFGCPEARGLSQRPCTRLA